LAVKPGYVFGKQFEWFANTVAQIKISIALGNILKLLEQTGWFLVLVVELPI